MVSLTRRALLGGMAASGVAATAAPVSSNWSNLRGAFSVPDWFRDAKFGIWAHWSAQCVPEAGDWYGRLMYVQGHPMYAHQDRKSTRLNSSHSCASRMPSFA